MRFRHVPRRDLLSACAEPGPDDGLDPRHLRQLPRRQVPNRKALQVCGQVARTLAGVLAGECGDDLLRDLVVDVVVPAPNSARLLVTLRPAVVQPFDAALILARLEKARGLFRREVAAAIHRRRVPDLLFRLAENS